MLFHKIFYDDENKTFEEATQQEFSDYEETSVKVIVQNKTNPYWFDIVLDKLYKCNPLNVSSNHDKFGIYLIYV